MSAPHRRIALALSALAVLLVLSAQSAPSEQVAGDVAQPGPPLQQAMVGGVASLVPSPPAEAAALDQTAAPGGEVKLMVLYPQPADADQFESDYRDHLQLLHDAMGIPEDDPPYTVTKFLSTSDGPAPFYQLFTWTFPSAEALGEARGTEGMQKVAADAGRISSGGPPVVLIGIED